MVAAVVVVGLVSGLGIEHAARVRLIASDPWQNGLSGAWTWVPFLHPPLQGEWLRGLDALARAAGDPRGVWVLRAGAVASAVSAGAVAWLLRDRGTLWMLVGAALLLFAPSRLRAFEAYPIATALVALATVAWIESGTSARAGSVAGLLALAAVETHLFAAALLVPPLVVLGRRRAVAVVVLLAGFAASTAIGGFWDILGRSGEYSVVGEDLPTSAERLSHWVSLEWTGVVLAVGAIVGWIGGRRGLPQGLTAAGVAAGIYTAAIGVGQYTGALMHGEDRLSRHHYLELTEPVLVVVAALGLAATRRRWAGVVAVALVVAQVATFMAGWDLLAAEAEAFRLQLEGMGR